MDRKEKKTARQSVEPTSPYWLDVITIIIICATFASAIIIMMNMKREIVSIDKEIADLEARNENYRSQIENQRKVMESLSTSKVIEFANKHKMITPQIGMTRNMDALNYGEEGRTMYANRTLPGTVNHNVATIQNVVPQFLKRHFE